MCPGAALVVICLAVVPLQPTSSVQTVAGCQRTIKDHHHLWLVGARTDVLSLSGCPYGVTQLLHGVLGEDEFPSICATGGVWFLGLQRLQEGGQLTQSITKMLARPVLEHQF